MKRESEGERENESESEGDRGSEEVRVLRECETD